MFYGAITTFAAGLSLYGGQLETFRKFAMIIISTIGISFLTSMLFFGALLHTFGPQDGWCDLCVCFAPGYSKKILNFNDEVSEIGSPAKSMAERLGFTTEEPKEINFHPPADANESQE